jgi:hypothetical protein
VDEAGREMPFPWAELPPGFHAHVHLLNTFSSLSDARRDAVCRSWANALAARRGAPVANLRVYQETWDLSRRTPNGRADAAGRARILRYAWTAPLPPLISAATSHASSAAAR